MKNQQVHLTPERMEEFFADVLLQCPDLQKMHKTCVSLAQCMYDQGLSPIEGLNVSMFLPVFVLATQIEVTVVESNTDAPPPPGTKVAIANKLLGYYFGKVADGVNGPTESRN